MRFLFALLVAIAIPFNAAYAAGASVCDSMEGHAPHGEHLGHHAHAHSHEGNDGRDGGGSDHNHSHAHPLLSWILPAPIGIHLPTEISTVLPLPLDNFISALIYPLERPPRHVRVA